MALSLPLSRALPQLPRFGLLSAAIALPSISITIPPLLSDLWDSVLRAVPKKKTSHMKKRHRQMAGKALKDVQSLNKCPGCGQIKRAHLLCPTCVKDIQQSWRSEPVQTA
ncbi:54S ribosomal protein L32 [Penicillium verhagenii]|uniref:54S ribosomal protein L32 n=1 Tax=Penicillium verhagenii TaxID=1562060 RepID=UPI00254520EE|nr:54S ribosomal protein L32 [Penicillium verhagenii]KAJ5936975.1 54S ribosomal protein L32 [Penicillium verhagenii]